MHPDTPRTDDTSVPEPAAPLYPEPADEPADSRPNRAARRGKRAGAASASHAHGAALHARGAQGRRINPVRRTG